MIKQINIKRPYIKDYYTGNQLTHFEYMNRYRDDMEKYADHLENRLAEISKIQRYDIEGGSGHNAGTYFEIRSKEGQWVKHEDLNKIVNGK